MNAEPPWGLIDARPILERSGPGDAAASGVASLQHGLITIPQLLFVGLSRHAVSYRVRSGRLHRVHRGVYLVGHSAITEVGTMAAAVLACGPGAMLSHRSAAFLWGLLPFWADPIHVSLAASHRRPRPGIKLHRIGPPHRRDVRRRELVPVTAPARTILDLAETSEGRDLELALNEGRTRKLVYRSELLALKERTPGRRGWSSLLPLLRIDGEDDFSRQEAEKLMLRLIRSAQLPAPRRNVRVHGYELDFFWPELGLNVEVDGYQWHSARHSLNRDRDRDTGLAARGIQVIRFTRDQLLTPALVVARLAAAIALAGQNAGAARA